MTVLNIRNFFYHDDVYHEEGDKNAAFVEPYAGSDDDSVGVVVVVVVVADAVVAGAAAVLPHVLKRLAE